MSKLSGNAIELTVDIRQRLNELRKENKYSIKRLSSDTGFSESKLKNILSPKGATQNISPEDFERLAKCLYSSTEYIKGETDSRYKSRYKEKETDSWKERESYPGILFNPRDEAILNISEFLRKDENIDILNSLHFLFFDAPEHFRDYYIEGINWMLKAFRHDTLWNLSSVASDKEKIELMGLLRYGVGTYREQYTLYLKANKLICNEKYNEATLLLLELIRNAISSFSHAEKELAFSAYEALMKIINKNDNDIFYFYFPDALQNILKEISSYRFNLSPHQEPLLKKFDKELKKYKSSSNREN